VKFHCKLQGNEFTYQYYYVSISCQHPRGVTEESCLYLSTTKLTKYPWATNRVISKTQSYIS